MSYANKATGNTAKRRTELAHKAREHGHFRPNVNTREFYLFCPVCRDKVEGEMASNDRSGNKSMDAYMTAHLEFCLDGLSQTV